MKSSKSGLFFDSLIILLNIAGSRGNYLLYWLLGLKTLPKVMIFVICMDIIYLVFNLKTNHSSAKLKFPKQLYVLFILLSVNLLNTLLTSDKNLLMYFIQIAYTILFSIILYNIANKYLKQRTNEAVRLFSRGYVWISLFSIVGVIVSFILCSVIGLSLKPATADFFLGNDIVGESYYRTYLSLNMYASIPRVPFFQEYGFLCGLFHEPSALAWNIFPCLILLLGFASPKKTRWLVIGLGICMMLFAGSATNILVIVACLLVYSLMTIRRKLFSVVLGVAVILGAALLYFSIDDTFLQFLMGRLEEGNGSQLYSLSTLIWTLSPRTLMGSDFLDASYVRDIMDYSVSSKDVGYIPFLLNLIIIVSFVTNIIKLLRTKDKVCLSVGFASLYYILHSAKVGMPMLVQSLPVFLIFLQLIALSQYGRIKAFSRNC